MLAKQIVHLKTTSNIENRHRNPQLPSEPSNTADPTSPSGTTSMQWHVPSLQILRRVTHLGNANPAVRQSATSVISIPHRNSPTSPQVLQGSYPQVVSTAARFMLACQKMPHAVRNLGLMEKGAYSAHQLALRADIVPRRHAIML